VATYAMHCNLSRIYAQSFPALGLNYEAHAKFKHKTAGQSAAALDHSSITNELKLFWTRMHDPETFWPETADATKSVTWCAMYTAICTTHQQKAKRKGQKYPNFKFRGWPPSWFDRKRI